ncbi:MDR/zinc-dependent alcohol dehydrogenase-like family protein [Amycolatopsis rifamycinica]|uniref:hypothetical protein n=1 Tax=Amycolatopsis rifamycinica TaxID=287986 RepID=UPI00190F763E|nr:hypothetical protein [Amycolatopsis rifamycinica]
MPGLDQANPAPPPRRPHGCADASPASFAQAFRSLRWGGRLVCVALPADGTMNPPIFDTVLGGKSVIGSIVGTRNDLADVLAGRVPARIVFRL